MSDESKTEAAEQNMTPASKRKSKKKWAILGGIVGVIAVAAIGVWVWHNDPSFCNNPVCHDSMDPYVATYYQADDSEGVDKYGNTVPNTHAMLVVSHQGGDVACLDCHVPDLRQQVGEVAIQLSGGYSRPLEEVDALDLVLNANHTSESGLGDEFCMNENCHSNLSRESLTQLTASMEFNPHAWQHKDNQCTECHKSHRQSVLACTQCHDGSDPDRPDATGSIPEGWVDYPTSTQLQVTPA